MYYVIAYAMLPVSVFSQTVNAASRSVGERDTY